MSQRLSPAQAGSSGTSVIVIEDDNSVQSVDARSEADEARANPPWAPLDSEAYEDFIERKYDDVLAAPEHSEQWTDHPKRGTSGIWEHFRIDANGGKVCCVSCDMVIKYDISNAKDGTGNLNRHRKSCTRRRDALISPPASGESTGVATDMDRAPAGDQQPSVMHALFNAKFTAQAKASMDQLTLQAFLHNYWSFNSVESPPLRKLIERLTDGKWSMPTTRLTQLCDQYYEKSVGLLLEHLKNFPNVCLTTDAATLTNNDPYLCLTAHYITEEWLMEDVVLAVTYMPERHTGFNLSTLLAKLLAVWELQRRVYSFTSDNGSNFVNGIGKLAAELKIEAHLRCSCHTLQIVVVGAIDEVPELKPLLAKCRRIASLYRSSSNFKREVTQAQRSRVQQQMQRVDADADEDGMDIPRLISPTLPSPRCQYRC